MEISSFLKLLSTFTIQATDGKSVIAQEKELFNGYLDSDFKNWGLDETGDPTPETKIQVFELVKGATFNQFFNSISSELDKLCLTQSQIIEICRNHRNLLNQDCAANFFLMKENEKYFVTFISLYSSGLLDAFVLRFDCDFVWGGSLGNRFLLQDA